LSRNILGEAMRPYIPPATPDAVAIARCRNCELVRGEGGSVRNATLSAASSPSEVAEVIAFKAKEGRAYPISSTVFRPRRGWDARAT